MKIKWYGNAGHLIVSGKCRFHLCTEVGKYLVSTVGEYYSRDSENMDTIGAGKDSFFETYIFKINGRCECGCGMPTHDGSEIDGKRYSTRKEANEGHSKYVAKYAKRKA